MLQERFEVKGDIELGHVGVPRLARRAKETEVCRKPSLLFLHIILPFCIYIDWVKLVTMSTTITTTSWVGDLGEKFRPKDGLESWAESCD